MTAPLVELEHVRVTFRASGLGRTSHDVAALDDVDVSVRAGESLGIVGESGSGKSTLARLALGLLRPDSGQVRWNGEAIDPMDRRRMRKVRREMQPVFQDPVGSLDPRMTVRACIAEALEALEDLRDRNA